MPPRWTRWPESSSVQKPTSRPSTGWTASKRSFLPPGTPPPSRTQLDGELTALEQSLAALGGAEAEKVSLEARGEQLARRETALAQLAQSLAEGQRRGQAARQAQERYLLADGAKERAHALRDHLERAFLNAQAGLLAEGLTDGTPCPVCGSTHHPKRAVLPAEAPTQARVDAARQSADEADHAAQEASAAAAKVVAADREAKATLRRDAEALLPERFTSPEGPVKLTVSLLKTALAEESEALHAAQEALDKSQKQNAAALAAKARQEDERQKKTAQRSALEAEARASAEEAARQSASAKALETQCTEARAALPAADREEARRALAGLENERCALRAGMDAAASALARARQDYAAAKAAVTALTAQQTEAGEAADLPALESQRDALTARRTALAAQEKALTARLLPNRKAADLYRQHAAARAELERRWQWVNALASTAGGTLSSKQKIRLEAYIQMNYLDAILVHANTRLMQMTAGQYELERVGAENQRSQASTSASSTTTTAPAAASRPSRAVKASKPHWRWLWASRTKSRARRAASGWTLSSSMKASARWTTRALSRPSGSSPASPRATASWASSPTSPRSRSASTNRWS